jgi:hypothetical protein
MGYEWVGGASTGSVLYHSETKNWLSSSQGYVPVYSASGTASASSEDGRYADTYSDYSYDFADPSAGSGGSPMGSGGGARQHTPTLTC